MTTSNTNTLNTQNTSTSTNPSESTKHSQPIMSTSGIRGIVGHSMTPQLAIKCAQAFGTYSKKGHEIGTIIVGGDTRTSHDCFKHAIISGLLSVGIHVIYIGKVPTPTVQHAIRHHKADGGIVITASHNPIEWNGIKLMSSKGAFLTEEEYQAFQKIYLSDNLPLSNYANQGTLKNDVGAINRHIDAILEVVDPTDIQNAHFKVLVDPNHGTGGIATALLLDRLNVDYDMIYETPDGKFSHPPEPLKQNLSTLINAMKEGEYTIGFSQDPDADRLVIVDEKGRFIGEDYSLGLCIDYILQHEQFQHKQLQNKQLQDKQENPQNAHPSVVVNLSTSKVIEDIAKRYGAQTHYTRIGEVNVTEGLIQHNGIVGGEGNGGVIYPKIGHGRDSLVGITIALKYLAESKKTVSQITKTYPEYVMLREKITLENALPFQEIKTKLIAEFPEAKTDEQDGIKLMFDTHWIHVRPSNTEPIIRIFIESPDQKENNALFKRIKAIL